MANDDRAEWLEVSVEVDDETAEAVAEVISRYAPGGVVIEGGPEGWHEGMSSNRGCAWVWPEAA